MTIQELLKNIGLTDKEVTMYIALLRHGTQSTSVLARHTDFNRGTAYVILHQLLRKGLITESVKSKVQYFTPLPPDHLVRYLEHREQEILTQKERVQGMMGQLIAITNPMTSKPRIQFFDGVEGARAVLEDTITAKEKMLQAFLSIADISAFVGAKFFEDYTQHRIKAGYSLQAIRTLEKDREALQKNIYARQYMSKRKDLREVRYVPEELAFPMTMYMYDQKLALISSKEENFALLVESKELAEMQKKLFHILWQTAKARRT
jgi:sugar-specific transcriptional regulator TrmB